MVDWFTLVGGNVSKDKENTIFVQYGKGKKCYYRQDGSKGVRLHFHGDDALTASIFLIKFFKEVQTHNMKENCDE